MHCPLSPPLCFPVEVSWVPVRTALQGDISVYFLRRESKQVQGTSKSGDSAVVQQDYQLPVSHGHDSLVSGRPDSIPGPVKRI